MACGEVALTFRRLEQPTDPVEAARIGREPEDPAARAIDVKGCSAVGPCCRPCAGGQCGAMEWDPAHCSHGAAPATATGSAAMPGVGRRT
mmetsp:Transcript_68013/g.215198  ORF Transcript_68013/g.215198 Transcript_68013/m.215198 type:complete len:90 (-) Transcript_68013:598-867(-)